MSLSSNSLSLKKMWSFRRTVSLAQCLIAVIAFASLSGCATMKAIDNFIDPLATPIGDPSRPVMEQGQGSVAMSLEYTMPHPEFLRMGKLITDIRFKSLDGDSKRDVYVGTGRNVPALITKLPHAENVTVPIIHTFSLKPGQYRIDRVSLGIDYPNLRIFSLNDGPVITVVAGKVTYIGNYQVKYDAQFNSKGSVVLNYVVITGPHDQFARDVGELKSAEKRLQDVVITKALMR